MKLKRALSGVVVAALAAIAVPLLTAAPALAGTGTLQGPATISTGSSGNPSGDSATSWTLQLPSGASCPTDSVTPPNWTWSTYMVPQSVDVSTLTFDSGGPQPQRTGANFQEPLFLTNSNPALGNTIGATNPGGPGPIPPMGTFNFKNFLPGDIPAGVYNVGVACISGSSPKPIGNYWKTTLTVQASGTDTGPAGISWFNGTAPSQPTITGLTPGTTNASTGQMSVAFTNPAANPALTSCTLFIGTASGGTDFSGPSGQSGSCTSPRVVTGLTYGTTYFFRMMSTNAVGNSPVSNELSSSTVRPAVTNLSATPSPNTVDLTWTPSVLIATGEVYNIDVCTLPATNPCLPASSGHVNPTATSASPSYHFTPAVAGQQYTFTVTYGATGTSQGASVQSVPLSNSILIQDITVGRPNGALVLTQVCGKWDQMAAESGQIGFPNGLPLSAASASGTAPTTGSTAYSPTGPTDPVFSQYPYPDNPDGTANPTYPTHCGIALGAAHFVRQGAPGALGAGQYFSASGRLNQVTVVDTRDTDPGWTVNFQESSFSNGTNTFSGNDLGWTAQKTQTPSFQDGSGTTYAQAVNFATAPGGQSMTPATQGANGAGTAHGVITAAANSGLGIATLDARIKVLIPVWAKNGNYAGTLTINAV